jgi:hypothetical protein
MTKAMRVMIPILIAFGAAAIGVNLYLYVFAPKMQKGVILKQTTAPSSAPATE